MAKFVSDNFRVLSQDYGMDIVIKTISSPIFDSSAGTITGTEATSSQKAIVLPPSSGYKHFKFSDSNLISTAEFVVIFKKGNLQLNSKTEITLDSKTYQIIRQQPYYDDFVVCLVKGWEV